MNNTMNNAQEWVESGTETMPNGANRIEVTDMTSTWEFQDGSIVILCDGDKPYVIAN